MFVHNKTLGNFTICAQNILIKMYFKIYILYYLKHNFYLRVDSEKKSQEGAIDCFGVILNNTKLNTFVLHSDYEIRQYNDKLCRKHNSTRTGLTGLLFSSVNETILHFRPHLHSPSHQMSPIIPTLKSPVKVHSRSVIIESTFMEMFKDWWSFPIFCLPLLSCK